MIKKFKTKVFTVCLTFGFALVATAQDVHLRKVPLKEKEELIDVYYEEKSVGDLIEEISKLMEWGEVHYDPQVDIKKLKGCRTKVYLSSRNALEVVKLLALYAGFEATDQPTNNEVGPIRIECIWIKPAPDSSRAADLLNAKAIDAYGRALIAMPMDGSIKQELIDLFMARGQQGDYEKACGHLVNLEEPMLELFKSKGEKTKAEMRKFADVCLKLGKCYLGMKQPGNALGRFENVMNTFNRRKLTPDHDYFEALIGMAKSHYAKKDFGNGLKVLESDIRRIGYQPGWANLCKRLKILTIEGFFGLGMDSLAKSRSAETTEAIAHHREDADRQFLRCQNVFPDLNEEFNSSIGKAASYLSSEELSKALYFTGVAALELSKPNPGKAIENLNPIRRRWPVRDDLGRMTRLCLARAFACTKPGPGMYYDALNVLNEVYPVNCQWFIDWLSLPSNNDRIERRWPHSDGELISWAKTGYICQRIIGTRLTEEDSGAIREESEILMEWVLDQLGKQAYLDAKRKKELSSEKFFLGMQRVPEFGLNFADSLLKRGKRERYEETLEGLCRLSGKVGDVARLRLVESMNARIGWADVNEATYRFLKLYTDGEQAKSLTLQQQRVVSKLFGLRVNALIKLQKISKAEEASRGVLSR